MSMRPLDTLQAACIGLFIAAYLARLWLLTAESGWAEFILFTANSGAMICGLVWLYRASDNLSDIQGKERETGKLSRFSKLARIIPLIWLIDFNQTMQGTKKDQRSNAITIVASVTGFIGLFEPSGTVYTLSALTFCYLMYRTEQEQKALFAQRGPG